LERIKLFFLPYAGGSASVFLNWKRGLNQAIDIKPLELAGRGKRIHEPFYESVDEAATDIFKAISMEAGEGKYAIYGHSMGTILAYEVSKKIKAAKLNEPQHIFFSGRNSPDILSTTKDMHNLSDDDFIEAVLDYGGTNKEIFENEDLKIMFLPILRADFEMLEKYRFQYDDFKLHCNITVLNGKEDRLVSFEDIKKWEAITHGSCRFYEFLGGHFFINNYKDEICKIINETLK
jgi:surfactin synthase thioesterase subunit